MPKTIYLRKGFKMGKNPVNKSELLKVINLPSTDISLMEETQFTDGSEEYKILIKIPKQS